ncbi:MAG: SusC/RagA family TonB-linked outer membrane protein [Mediterranea sp.]|nr:SusC/RagA family TonB-linked outer membrane protein [Mediterranea sp.]
MKKKLMTLCALLAISIGAAMAQTTTVQGIVFSEDDGQPLTGATILVVGTNLGTTTNIDGRFSISAVPQTAKQLQVSFIGMITQTVPIKAGTIRVSLKTDSGLLDEVLIVAFGTATKPSFTGAASVVSSENLAKHTTSNVADALVGSVPGLQLRGSSGAPGASQGSIKIRGISSLYAGTDPLVIVDGAPYSASLSNIPQDDIQSVTVLKDAASAALYGARGASGVIIVTTKKGKTQKAVINVEAKWGVNSRSIQDYDVITDPGQYYEAYYSQLYNKYFYGDGLSAAAANQTANQRMLSDLSYNVFTVPDGQLLIGADGKLNPGATLGRRYTGLNGVEYYMIPDNWTDMAYKNALRQEYTVSVNGGNEQSSLYASVGYLDENGIIEYSGYKRITARLKAEYKATDWLKVSANAGYVHSNTESNPNMDTSLGSTNLMYYTTQMAPIYPAYVRVIDENGNPVIRTDEYGHQQYDYGVAGTNYDIARPFLATGNPLGSNRYNKVLQEGNQLNATFMADVNFTSWLKLNVTSTVTWGQTNNSNYQNPFYGPKAGVNGEINKKSTSSLRTNNIQTLTFTHDFGLNGVTVMAGHEYYKTNSKVLGATKYGGFSPDVPELNAFATMSGIEGYSTNYNVEGFFGNAQYDYDDKYFASASFRRDASSYFAKDHRWGNFWSVGAAWLLSKENFMANTSDWLPELKLKVSIGQQGNDNIGNYAYVDMYELSKAGDTSMSPTFWRMGNPDITWETTTNLNVGVEFSLWDNRLSGSVDWYNKKTSDLLFWLSIPESAGSRGYYGNVGDIRNSGVEVVLNGIPFKTRNFQWDISANISHNSTKILSLPDSKVGTNGGFTESSLWYEVGGPLYNSFRPSFAGLNEKGEATYWVDKDLVNSSGGSVTSKPGDSYDLTTTNTNNATRYAHGSMLPKAFGGFSTTLTFFGVDVSATFDYQLGGKIYDTRYAGFIAPAASASGAGSNIHKDYLKAWTPNNTASNMPRWQYGDQYSSGSSDRFLTNAGYLNFQSFSVGYTLPENLIPEVKKIRVYASGQNLIFWSARKGLDPRYSFTGNTTTNVYSPVRTISGGVQFTF